MLCCPVLAEALEPYHVSNEIRETSKRRPWPDPSWSAIGKKRNKQSRNRALYAMRHACYMFTLHFITPCQ
jgi:hypothetical protein